MNIPEEVILCEVGPRDGLQNEKRILTVEEKAELIDLCSDAGYKVIEAGSFVHPKAVPQMATTDEVFGRIKKKEGVEYRALIANLKGAQRAKACGCDKVKLNVSASMAHNIANLNCTPAQSVERFGECADFARENGIKVSGSVSMAFGSPWEREIPLADVGRIVESYLKVGVDEISLSDASGMGIPGRVYALFEEMQRQYPEVTFWGHFHNTRGLGIANILAAMEAGIRRFDVSFAGCGGCPFVPGATGNVSSEDVLHMLDGMGINSGIDSDSVIAIGKRAVELTGHPSDSYILNVGRNKDLQVEMPEKRERK